MTWSRQGDTVYLPKMRTQAVAARTVAEALAALALSPDPEPAAGAPIPEIAGPREEYLPDLAAQLAARRGDPVKVEAVDNPADPDDALNANGGLLPSPHATLACRRSPSGWTPTPDRFHREGRRLPAGGPQRRSNAPFFRTAVLPGLRAA